MNNYRVDRVEPLEQPIGMNSILYIGDSFRKATRVFEHSEGGFDAWNKPNPAYGVGLFQWSNSKREYEILKIKGMTV